MKFEVCDYKQLLLKKGNLMGDGDSILHEQSNVCDHHLKLCEIAFKVSFY